jgi:hypothetical protein
MVPCWRSFRLRRRYGGALAFVLLAGIVACGPARQPAIVRCPDSLAETPCLTPPVCRYDALRKCDACRCASPPYVPKERTDVTAPPP